MRNWCVMKGATVVHRGNREGCEAYADKHGGCVRFYSCTFMRAPGVE